MRYRPNAAAKRLYSQSMRLLDEQFPRRGTPYAIRTGCKVAFARPDGDGGVEVVRGEVVAHSYGDGAGQHTFTVMDDASGAKRLVKGRNLYKNIFEHEPGAESLKL